MTMIASTAWFVSSCRLARTSSDAVVVLAMLSRYPAVRASTSMALTIVWGPKCTFCRVSTPIAFDRLVTSARAAWFGR